MRTLTCTAKALIIRALPNGPDTGRRMILDQTAVGHGQSYDGGWAYVVAPAGEGWSSTRYLEERAAVPDRAWVARPHGLIAIRETFGEAGNPRCSSGRVQLPAPIGTTTRFACHELMVPIFSSVFEQIHQRGYWPLLRTWNGCYNYRTKTGTSTKLSTHSWGISSDLNAATNRYGQRDWDMPRPIIAIFDDHGFIHGGSWSTPDGMHFQYASGY